MGLTTRVPSTPLRYYVGLQSKRRRLVRMLLVWPAILCIAIVFYACLPGDWYSSSTLVSERYVLFAWAGGVIALAGGIIWTFSFIALTKNWNWVTSSLDSALDERLIGKKNEALARSFGILAMMLPLEMLFLLVRSFFSSDHQGQLAQMMFALDLLLSISLPRAVIAWTEPDALDGEGPSENVFVTSPGA
jgi:hypothetical protein